MKGGTAMQPFGDLGDDYSSWDPITPHFLSWLARCGRAGVQSCSHLKPKIVRDADASTPEVDQVSS
jgi:hypothetical protein